MSIPVSTKDIISYYNQSQWLYKTFWSPKNLGMHVGFWDDKTKSVDEAVDNENRMVMDAANISDSSTVLDAGCGMGSTAIYIGKHSKAKVYGVSIVSKQIETANNYAKKLGLSPRISFQFADYTMLPFTNNYFDVVYGIESICHAYPKESFLNETHRILKKGGRLIISDGYMNHPPKNDYEQILYDEFCRSFALSELIPVGVMKKKIINAKFHDLIWKDMTKNVDKGAMQMHKLYSLVKFFVPFIPIRSIRTNANALHASVGLYTENIGCYGIFSAVK